MRKVNKALPFYGLEQDEQSAFRPTCPQDKHKSFVSEKFLFCHFGMTKVVYNICVVLSLDTGRNYIAPMVKFSSRLMAATLM